MVKETGLYDELGIAPDATEQQIRSAYRSMALKYHPDKNNGDAAAAEKFKKVAEAYEILSDADRRKQYDTFGRNGPSMGGGSGGAGGFAGGFPGGFGQGGVDPMDIFSHFFGFTAGQQQQQRQTKPPFILLELQCSLEELYCGTAKVLSVRRRRVCAACKGFGTANARPPPVCPQCKGNKTVMRQINFGGIMTYQQSRCGRCEGTGKLPINAACAKCASFYEAWQRSATLQNKAQDPLPRGVVVEVKKIKLTIAPGTEDSDAINFLGQGDELPGFAAAGDILVVIEQLAHPCYRRLNSADLFLSNCRVPLWCLFRDNFAIPIELLDGRLVRLAPPKREGGVPVFLFDSQHVFVVENEGMPVKQPRDTNASGSSDAASATPTAALKKGKLYVCIDILFPASLTPTQATAIAQALSSSRGGTAATTTTTAPSSPKERVVALQPHRGPAPSWHTVDAQGNAAYKPNASSGTKKKKKAAAP